MKRLINKHWGQIIDKTFLDGDCEKIVLDISPKGLDILLKLYLHLKFQALV